MSNRRVALFSLFIVLVLSVGPAGQAPAQEKQALSIEWMFGKGPEAIAAVSNYAWLSDGSLLMCDIRKPEAERAWELLDPATGVSKPAFDMAKARASLKTLIADAPAALPWPGALDASGNRALFIFGKDIYVLDRVSSQFQQTMDSGCLSRSTSRRTLILRRNIQSLFMSMGGLGLRRSRTIGMRTAGASRSILIRCSS